MKQNLAALFALFLLLDPVFSQEQKDTAYHNAVKINMAAAVFRKLTLSYERQFGDRWSGQIAAGYKFGGGIPQFVGLGEFVVASETNGIRGLSVTPDVRYHFKNCDCGNKTGLYAGVYASYTRLYGELEFNYWNGTDYVDVGGAGNLQEYGIGLELGYQFVFKGRWVVDLMFMGPRTSFQRLKLELDSQFAADIIPLIEAEINERLEWWGMDPISIPTDANAVIDFRFNNFRYTVGIGYLF